MMRELKSPLVKPDFRPDDPTVDMRLPKTDAHLFYMVRKTIFFWIVWFAVVMLLPAFSGLLQAAETSQPLVKSKMKIAFLQSFFADVNRLDAEAAMKVFAQTMGELHGYDVDVGVQTFQQAQDILSDPHADKMEIIILDSWSYLDIEKAQWIEPALVSSEQEQVARRYLLLTPAKKEFNTLVDLRGKSLNLLATSNALLGIPWLKTLLLEQHLGKPEEFFSQVYYQSDPMRTVLQVFFGKIDVALVDAMRFELMTELNPQLSRLKAIETSEPFVSFIFCLKRSGWSPPKLKQDIIDTANKLHLEPKAEQVFTLFKFGRLVPFEPGQLDSVRRLRQRAIDAERKSAAQPRALNGK